MVVKNTIRLYNTMTRDIEDFTPINDHNIGIYTCGPTVYDYTHIGHVRKYVMDDVLIRLLRYLAFNVKHVMNITDVGHLVSDDDTGEDKMEKGARREGKTAWEVAKFFEKQFFDTMDAVLIKRPDIIARATDHIKEQIDLIKCLEEKGYTYTISDGVYYDTSKFPDYGKLARINTEGQKLGARVEPVPGKKHSTDFALWKLTPKGVKRDMEWESPWGKGFPGWHIECSAMSMKYLGESFDIHTGGIDHIAIHHPNEIAQSEACTGKKFVKYWVHHNFVLVNGEKMSKSKGNFFRLDNIVEKGFDPLALRYLYLQTHYRQETNFTWESLESAQTALNQLRNQMTVIKRQVEQPERSELSEEKLAKIDSLRKKFKDVIRMDLNTPQAIAVMWEMVKSNVPASDKYDLLMIVDEVLGLGLSSINSEQPTVEDIPQEVLDLVKMREKLRNEKKFSEADEIRKQVDLLGYIIVDTSQGSVAKKK